MSLLSSLERRVPLLLVLLSIGTVVFATLVAHDTSFVDAALVVAVLGFVGVGCLLLYWVYRLCTAWMRRRTTERIVVGQIATVVRQQLPLATALALAAESEQGWTRKHLVRISQFLAQGLPLSEAIRIGYPDCSSLPLSLIVAGEQAGQLPAALDQAEQYLIDRERSRQQADMSVWPYLLIVGTTMVLLVSGIMVAIVPKFKEIFKDFGTRLPEPTRALISVSEQMVSGTPPLWWFGLLIPVGVYLGLRPRRYPGLARSSRMADWVRWHTPGWRRVEMARGLSATLLAMRLGVRSGMSIEQAAGLATLIDVNHCLRPRIRQFAELLAEGTNARDAACRAGLGNVTGVALASGQRAGDMDAALRYAVDYHGALASRWWILLRNLAWPAGTLAMGVIVAMVVLAIFLPLIALIESVEGGGLHG